MPQIPFTSGYTLPARLHRPGQAVRGSTPATVPALAHRDPQQLRTGLGLLRAFRAQSPSQSYDDHLTQVQNFTGIIFAAIKPASSLFAGSTYRVVRRKRKNRHKTTFGPGGAFAKALPTAHAHARDEEYVPFDDLSHPLASMIERPNRTETFGGLARKLAEQYLLTGIAPLWVVPSASGKPLELWALKTPTTLPIAAASQQYPDGAWRVTPYFAAGWAFGPVGGRIGAGGAILPAHEVARFLDPDPLIEGAGYSRLKAAGVELDVLQAIQRSRKSVMDQGVNLNAALIVPGMDPAVVDRLEERINQTHGGADNAGKVWVIAPPAGGQAGDKADLKTFPGATADLGHLEGYEQMAKMVSAIFGCPPAVIGFAAVTSYSELYAARQQFHDTQSETIHAFGDWLTRTLCWPYEKFPGEFRVQIDLPGIDDKDLLERRLGPDTNRLFYNEARGLRGLPPVQGGDVPEQIYLKWLDQQLFPPQQPAAAPGGGQPGADQPGGAGAGQPDQNAASAPSPGQETQGDGDQTGGDPLAGLLGEGASDQRGGDASDGSASSPTQEATLRAALQALGLEGDETVTKSFDESKHPRDHGKFAKKPGAGKKTARPAAAEPSAPTTGSDAYGTFRKFGDAIDPGDYWGRLRDMPDGQPVALFHATSREAAEKVLANGFDANAASTRFSDSDPNYVYLGAHDGLGAYVGLQGGAEPAIVVVRVLKGDLEPDLGHDWDSHARVHRKELKKRGIDPNNPSAVETFAEINQVRAHKNRVEPIGMLLRDERGGFTKFVPKTVAKAIAVTKPGAKGAPAHREGEKFQDAGGHWKVIKQGRAVPTSAPTAQEAVPQKVGGANPGATSAPQPAAPAVAPGSDAAHDDLANRLLGGRPELRLLDGSLKGHTIRDGKSLREFFDKGGKLPPGPWMDRAAQGVPASEPQAKGELQRAHEWAGRMAAKHAGRVAQHFGISPEKARALLEDTIRKVAEHALKNGGKATGTLRSSDGKTLRVGVKDRPVVEATGKRAGGPTAGAVPRPRNPAGAGSRPPAVAKAAPSPAALIAARFAALVAERGPDAARAVLEAAGVEAVLFKGEWEESKHPRDHGKFSSKPGGTSAHREEIGSGNTGKVYREGDEAVKGAKRPDGTETREGEFYDALKGVDGVAPGYRTGDEIRTPHYQEVLSVDTVPDARDRESMGSEVGRNKNRLLNAANAMGEAGIDYNDPLQVGFDDEYNAHVLDLSNAGRVPPDVALRANIERVARFMEDFGAKHTADAILRALGVYNFAKGLSGGSKESAARRVNALAEKGNRTALHVRSIGPEKVAGYDVKHVYYATNPRPVLRDVLQSEPDADGVKIILSDKPLDADTIRQYNLTPVVHPATRSDAPSVKPAA